MVGLSHGLMAVQFGRTMLVGERAILPNQFAALLSSLFPFLCDL